MILIIQFPSCVTCPKNQSPDPVAVVAESIEFPEFPDPGSAKLNGDIVSMPLDLWLAIVDYVMEVEQIKQEIEAAKAAKDGIK